MSGARILIINSIQGGGGHRLGRIFSCYENIYWYSHPNNGLTPWTFATNGKLKEAAFSKYHYDRILEDGTRIPLIGSRIEKYWGNDDWLANWKQLMANIILPDKFITFVVHDSPTYLRRLFPRSVIVNLLSNDTDYATDRHMETSANFRIDYKFEGQIPKYKSKWVRTRDALLELNKDVTEKEAWSFMHPDQNYYEHMLKFNKESNTKNFIERKDADYTITWQTFQPDYFQEHFGKIDNNYRNLIV